MRATNVQVVLYDFSFSCCLLLIHYSFVPTALLLSIVGPYMQINGACIDKQAVVEPLTPLLPLLYLVHRPHYMVHLARTFKSLKSSVHKLMEQHRTNIYKQFEMPLDSFPAHVTIASKEPLFSIRYEARVGQTLCFQARVIKHHSLRDSTPALPPVGSAIFIKFIRKYGIVAHNSVCNAGYAPKLYSCLPLPG